MKEWDSSKIRKSVWTVIFMCIFLIKKRINRILLQFKTTLHFNKMMNKYAMTTEALKGFLTWYLDKQ